MNDRELLELAAKAAGLQIGHWVSFFGGEFAVTQNHSEVNSWNPLECDANAMQLAVDLRLNVYHAASGVYVEDYESTIGIREPHSSNPYASTRRAIVQAAAAIGAAL